MADPIWQTSTCFLWNFDNFSRIRLETVTRVLLRLLITNLKSESRNSKWRIQYGVQVHGFLVKLWKYRSNSLKNDYSGVFEVADYETRHLNALIAVSQIFADGPSCPEGRPDPPSDLIRTPLEVNKNFNSVFVSFYK